MLTADQHDEFRATGLLRLRGAFPQATAEAMCDRIQHYMNDGTVVDGVPLRVVELTGQPGDVILMHCDCFHAAAPNRLTEPRMMLTGMIGPNRSQQ